MAIYAGTVNNDTLNAGQTATDDEVYGLGDHDLLFGGGSNDTVD